MNLNFKSEIYVGQYVGEKSWRIENSVVSHASVNRSVCWFSVSVLLYGLYSFCTLTTLRHKLVHVDCY